VKRNSSDNKSKQISAQWQWWDRLLVYDTNVRIITKNKMPFGRQNMSDLPVLSHMPILAGAHAAVFFKKLTKKELVAKVEVVGHLGNS